MRSLATLIVSIVFCCSCSGGDSASKSESEPKNDLSLGKIGHTVGKVAGETIAGTITGTITGTVSGLKTEIDKTQAADVRLLAALSEAGFKITTAKTGHLGRLSVYLIGPAEYTTKNLSFVAKAFDANDQEIGRTLLSKNWAADHAENLEFIFKDSEELKAAKYFSLDVKTVDAE